jgi:Tfp pilus assembly protein PilF
MGRKLALVIGNSQYDDTGLARLATADVDVRQLANVLRDQEVGQFEEVIELANQGFAVVRRSVAQFFTQAKRDDLLLLYFSGHGVKDEHGNLYLAVKDTERHLLAGTGIEAAFITAQMDRSHSKRQVLILDCCHSGAFAYGAKTADGAVVGTGPAFEGRGYGRVVLTATDSTQYAWEGDQVIGESDKSVFTHYLLQGLKTGEADRDADGLITIDELYDYVYEHVVSETPKQTPGKWTYKQQGEIVIAQNAHPLVRPAELPLELRALLESPFPRLRAEAVPELASLLQSRHPGLALAARMALERLRTDDSRKVSAAAEAVLGTLPQAVPTPPLPAVPAGETGVARSRADEAQRRDEAERIRAARLTEGVRQIEAHLSSAEFDQAERAIDNAEAEFQTAEPFKALRGRLDLERSLALAAAEGQRVALERERKITAAIERAEAAPSHEAAIAVVRDALALDPENELARQLLSHREAALAQEEAERKRQQQISAAVALVDRCLSQGQLDDAQRALERAEQDFSDAPALPIVRARLAELRRQEVRDTQAREAAEQARRTFEAGRHEAALDALRGFNPPHELVSKALSELVAEFDRLQKEEALRREEAARRARQEQVAQHLAEARKAIAEQRFPEALDALGKAQQLGGGGPGSLVASLLREAEAGRAAADEAERVRRKAEQLLVEASQRLKRQELSTALAHVDAALKLDAQNGAAVALRDEIQQAIDEHRRREDLERQARGVVEQARRTFEAGRHQAALDALRGFDPPHELVSKVLSELVAELDRLQKEEALRREEAARRARQEQVSQYLAEARTAITEERFADGLEALRKAQQLEPRAEGLGPLLRQAEAGKKAADEAERARRQAEQLIAEASQQLMRQDLSRALAHIQAALELDPQNSRALALRSEIQHAVDERRQQEELERQARERRQKVAALVAKAEKAATHEAAIEALKEALGLDPAHEAAGQLLARRTAALEQEAAERQRQQEIATARSRIADLLQNDQLDEAEQTIAEAGKDYRAPAAFEEVRQRLRQKQHDRAASGAILAARAEFAAGRRDSAVARLESFGPPHPHVTGTLAEFRAEIERLRRQEEERMRAEAERLAREREIASLLDAARRYIALQQFDDARMMLGRVRRLDPDAAGVAELGDALEAARAAARQAERTRQELEKTLAAASKRFRRRDFTHALALVEEALRLDPQNSAASDLRAAIQQALREQAAVADSAESGTSISPGAFLRSRFESLRLSRPLYSLSFRWSVQLGLVAVVVTATLILYPEWRREEPVSDISVSTPATGVAEELGPPVSLPPSSLPQPAVVTPPSPSSIGPAPERAPQPVSEAPRAATPSRQQSSTAARRAEPPPNSRDGPADRQPPQAQPTASDAAPPRGTPERGRAAGATEIAPAPAPDAGPSRGTRVEQEPATVDTQPARQPQPSVAVTPPPVRVVETPVSSAPAQAPESPPPATTTDEADIRNLLREIEVAYERKDVGRLESLWPVQATTLRSQLALLNSVELTISDVKIDIRGDRANLSFRMDRRYDWRRAGIPTSDGRSWVVSLRRTGASWVIIDR